MKLATRLRRTRRRRGISQKELAAILGVKHGTVTRWEIGTRGIGLRSIPIVEAWIKGDAK